MLDAVEIEEADLRWRRSSHAAISAMLPSHSAFHSDTGTTLSRALTQRKKSIYNRRKSIAAVRGRLKWSHANKCQLILNVHCYFILILIVNTCVLSRKFGMSLDELLMYTER